VLSDLMFVDSLFMHNRAYLRQVFDLFSDLPSFTKACL
jgi:hypothetical protein